MIDENRQRVICGLIECGYEREACQNRFTRAGRGFCDQHGDDVVCCEISFRPSEFPCGHIDAATRVIRIRVICLRITAGDGFLSAPDFSAHVASIAGLARVARDPASRIACIVPELRSREIIRWRFPDGLLSIVDIARVADYIACANDSLLPVFTSDDGYDVLAQAHIFSTQYRILPFRPRESNRINLTE